MVQDVVTAVSTSHLFAGDLPLSILSMPCEEWTPTSVGPAGPAIPTEAMSANHANHDGRHHPSGRQAQLHGGSLPANHGPTKPATSTGPTTPLDAARNVCHHGRLPFTTSAARRRWPAEAAGGAVGPRSCRRRGLGQVRGIDRVGALRDDGLDSHRLPPPCLDAPTAPGCCPTCSAPCSTPPTVT